MNTTSGQIFDRTAVRLACQRRFKLALTVGLTLFFCVPYFALQHLRTLDVRRLELTWIDRGIPFDPSWVWVYQSAYLLMPIAPWLTTSGRNLAVYAQGFGLLSLVGFAFFAAFPVAGPRPEILPDNGMYRLLISYDGVSNAFPSLHCALATYSTLYASRALDGELSRGARLSLVAPMTLWTVAIYYSTLATKQHYFVDLPAGFLLAWAIHRLIWSRTRRAG